MQVRIIEAKRDETKLLNKSTGPILYELREYARKENNLPGFEVTSRFMEKLERDELTETDLPVSDLIATIESFERHSINRLDLLIRFLCTLEDYGEVVKQGELSQKIEEELRLLEKRDEEQIQPSVLDLNFTEIPVANSGNGDQDTFEMFARDFLLILGYEIEEGPSRGADGGKDLLVLEPFSGILSNTKKRWVVSCKHFAHSGKAVGTDDEINITDRVKKFKADGFMAFYSTIPSSQLNDNFSRLKSEMLIEVIDGARIKQVLTSNARLEPVIAQYFGQSYKENLLREKQHSFEKALLILEYEKKKKQQQAAIRNDAIRYLRAEREYDRKLELLKHQFNLDASYLKEN